MQIIHDENDSESKIVQNWNKILTIIQLDLSCRLHLILKLRK